MLARAWLAAALMFAAAADADEIRGTATFMQPVDLPPGAVFAASVQDVSRADATARILGSVRIEDPGAPPIVFSIPIDRTQLDSRGHYSVRATVHAADRLLYTTTRAYPVLTQGAGTQVAVQLQPAGAPRPTLVRPAAAPLRGLPATFAGDLPCADCTALRYRLNLFADESYFLSTQYLGRGEPLYDVGAWALASDGTLLVLQGGREAPLRLRIVDGNTLRLLGTDGTDRDTRATMALTRRAQFEPLEPQLTLRGMVRYTADGGSFTECLTRQRWPVASTGDSSALRREVERLRSAPDAEVLASVEGEIRQTPGAAGVTQPTLVVRRLIGVWFGETCGVRFATSELVNMYWKLTALNGRPVIAAPNQREPSLILASGDGQHRARGSGGCNAFNGSFELEGTRLRFGPLASSMAACADGMATEREYFETLPRVRHWRIVGQHLELLDESAAPLARYEARALR